MRAPTIEHYMTPMPITIANDQPMTEAHRMMREHRIRHLPVLHGGKLVGIVSDRDLHLLETLRDIDPDEVAVEDAMSPEIYAVAPDATLEHVVGEMAERKLGAAVVARGARVLGVFTTVDALHALAELLHGRAR